jgi:hypothetical protein
LAPPLLVVALTHGLDIKEKFCEVRGSKQPGVDAG